MEAVLSQKSSRVTFLLLLACTLPELATAETLNLGSVTGIAGQAVTVPIFLTNNGASISSLAIDIGYDSSLLTNPTAVTMPSASVSLTVPISSLTGSDNIGITGWCLAETSSSTGCAWSATRPVAHSFNGGSGQRTS